MQTLHVTTEPTEQLLWHPSYPQTDTSKMASKYQKRKREAYLMQKRKDNSNSLQKQEIEAVVQQAVERIEQKLPAFLEQSITQTEYFSGPLPHPENARQYEEILPGFTERTLTMAEKAQDHEITRSKRVDLYILFNKVTSTGLAFVLITGICTAGVWLIYKDKEIGGLGTLIAAAAALIGSFYNSRKSNK